MRKLERILKALANRRRLAILKYLKENKNAPVAEIAYEIDLSFKSTSKHLGILSAIDIIGKKSAKFADVLLFIKKSRSGSQTYHFSSVNYYF